MTSGPYRFAIGERLPGTKYVLVKQKGAGGMGTCFEVVKEPKIRGVMKILHPHLAKRPDMVDRFFREVSILAELDHPNIVRVTDYDKLADGTPFFVMELLAGKSLRHLLANQPAIPARAIYHIQKGILDGLLQAHEVGIVHRDIKPDNVMLHGTRLGDRLVGEPIVKLIDFGIAATESEELRPGDFFGTLAYAAPEQIRSEKPSPQTDLYAAGVVLFEMIARRRPFDHARDSQALRGAILHENAPPLRYFAPWVPADVEAVVTAALSKDRTARPKDAYEFLARLYAMQDIESTTRKPLEVNTTEPVLSTLMAEGAEEGAGEPTREEPMHPPLDGRTLELAPVELARELEAKPTSLERTATAPTRPEMRERAHGTLPMRSLAALPAPAPVPAPRDPESPYVAEKSAGGAVARTVGEQAPRRALRTVALVAASLALLVGVTVARVVRRTGAEAETASIPPSSSASAAPAVPLPARAAPAPVMADLSPSPSAPEPSSAAVASSPPAHALAPRPASSAPSSASAKRSESGSPPAVARATTLSPSSPAPKPTSRVVDDLSDMLEVPTAQPAPSKRPGAGL